MAEATPEVQAALAAAQKAEQARIAAQNLIDAQEISFLDGVTNIKQIREGRTQRESNRLKSRFITTFGFDRWSKLVANSR
jgi:hypothetical protein